MKEKILKKLETLEKIHLITMGRRPSGTKKDIQNIYDLYFDYFEPTKKETRTGCGSCAAKIYQRLRDLNAFYRETKKSWEDQLAELDKKDKKEEEIKEKPRGWQLRKSFIDDDGQEWCYGKKVE